MSKVLQPVNTSQNVMGVVGYIEYDDTFTSESGVTCDMGANLGATNQKIKLTTLPQGALILDAKLYVVEKFSANPTVFQIGTEKTPTQFASFTTQLGTAGVYSLTSTTFYAPSYEDIYLTLSVSKGVTTGKMFIYFTYIVPGRANEVMS